MRGSSTAVNKPTEILERLQIPLSVIGMLAILAIILMGIGIIWLVLRQGRLVRKRSERKPVKVKQVGPPIRPGVDEPTTIDEEPSTAEEEVDEESDSPDGSESPGGSEPSDPKPTDPPSSPPQSPDSPS